MVRMSRDVLSYVSPRRNPLTHSPTSPHQRILSHLLAGRSKFHSCEMSHSPSMNVSTSFHARPLFVRADHAQQHTWRALCRWIRPQRHAAHVGRPPRSRPCPRKSGDRMSHGCFCGKTKSQASKKNGQVPDGIDLAPRIHDSDRVGAWNLFGFLYSCLRHVQQ